mmetsp:Transcript_9875/g.15013  ORF Transcript_9875/g.15013 Transcript_9875/m.15013 type:complete len:296 (-) Transcript_9875:128-1015(-)|eukprot:CAMPEP_0202712424 /NCGR_PEP_ID=MMETSP1385-20130828/39685_1 /ASSEMBLY_ACC=CAM_ASM_000861 /TAXON_ID=933848 /ORGANISM="Elphidium margaritaceum" /LENGTH=295 /DNA_ID=CAMNT_0049372451 /DNA_START=56 /DNA_END=943 /DNA_ORIENTATION=+
MNEAQQMDLLDLELSHDMDAADYDVSKPVSNDGMDLFNVNYDDPTQTLLANNIDTNEQRETTPKESVSLNLGSNKLDSPTTPGNSIDPSNAKCWHVEYYQTYFDVDTKDELHRLRKALFPFRSGAFYDPDLNEKPDLYGPFWITTTLAFLMAAMGNFAAYINTTAESVGAWSGDITRITEAATFLYTETTMVPILLYIVLRSYSESKGMIELLSLYGYSLMPFVVACVLCVAPWNLFDWIAVLLAMSTSIKFLIKNIYQTLPEDKRSKPGVYVLVIIFGCQAILTLALKCYFFKY